jgi:hypothetical protein
MTPFYRGFACLLLAGAAGGCDRQPGNPAQTGSSYTSDADSDAAEHGREGTRQGRALETEPKLAGFRVQLDQIRRGNPGQQNLSAYKASLADVVSSMEADLRRVGAGEAAERTREAGDSLVNTFGGGTGPAERVTPEELRGHVRRVEQLIQEYQGTIRRSGR